MALGDPYAQPAELALRLGAAETWAFAGFLEDASRAVESFCHRQFNNTTVASARTFKPVDGCLTIVDDFHTVTGLVVATDDDNDGVFETTWTTAYFEVSPTDGVVSGMGGWPYWMVNAVSSRHFRCQPRSNVQVTAQWGWAAVPAGVKEATLAVAEALVTKSPGKTRSIALDGYSESYKVDDENVGPFSSAAPYQRFEGFA